MDRNGEEHPAAILVVDDDCKILRLFRRILERKSYHCSVAENARDARRQLKNGRFDLVFCDVNMPGESGLDFIRHIAAEWPETAVIMVSGVDDPDVAEAALEIGAYGYIIKPFEANEVIINTSSALRRQRLEVQKRTYMEKLEALVDIRTAKLQETLDNFVPVIALIVESRDPYTAGHQSRVAEFACIIAKEMGLPEDRIKGIRMAASIHDLGKISIPSEILSKPSRLSALEFELIKTHPDVGYDILKNIEFSWPIADIVRQHHERIDGSGYPLGLTGGDLLIESKIIAVADTIEAMASHRPYRVAFEINSAVQEIGRNRGKHFDSEVVDACLSAIEKQTIF